MAKKHFRFFISSTFEEFKDERMEIINYISYKGDIPIGMEFFSPDFSHPEKQIKEKIRKSDAVILCIGANAGSFSKESPDKTYVRKEIDWALSYGKSIYSYVCETRYEGSDAILNYIDSIAEFSYKKYSRNDPKNNLTQVFKNSYSDIIRSLRSIKNLGLVEASYFEKFHTIGEINNDALSVSLICNVLEEFSKPKKLIGRMKNNTEQKSYAGYTLWRTIGELIFSNKTKVNIYYDGGASVVYACTSLINYLIRHQINHCSIISYTNSPITQLVFFYHSYKNNKLIEPATLVPGFGYYSDYGVCLGDIMNYPPSTTDALWEDKSKYFEYAKIDYKTISKLDKVLNAGNDKSLIVSSISGYALSSNKKMNGPWVRSFPNYIFKSLLLDFKIPIFFLLDDHKWNREMQMDRSINLLPEKYLEKENELPICYILSTYDENKHSEFINYFKSIGFNKRTMVDSEYKSSMSKSNTTIYGVAVFTNSFVEKMS